MPADSHREKTNDLARAFHTAAHIRVKGVCANQQCGVTADCAKDPAQLVLR